jgi:predicted DNA-binding protein
MENEKFRRVGARLSVDLYDRIQRIRSVSGVTVNSIINNGIERQVELLEQMFAGHNIKGERHDS